MSDSREEFTRAMAGRLDVWVPANGGTEVPFMKDGRRFLYVYNPATGKHGMLDMSSDTIIDDLEYYATFGRM